MKTLIEFLSEASILEEGVSPEAREALAKQASVHPNDRFATHRDGKSLVNHMADGLGMQRHHIQKSLKWLKDGNIKQEDLGSVADDMKLHDKVKSKLSPEHKDLGKLSRETLRDVVSPHRGQAITRKEKEKESSEKGRTLLHKDDNLEVHRLEDNEHGKAASIKHYGVVGEHPTHWCTAADSDQNMHKHYAPEGLYTFHTKGEKGNTVVHQYHPASNQLMDKNDNEVKPSYFSKKHNIHHLIHEGKLKELSGSEMDTQSQSMKKKKIETDPEYSKYAARNSDDSEILEHIAKHHSHDHEIIKTILNKSMERYHTAHNPRLVEHIANNAAMNGDKKTLRHILDISNKKPHSIDIDPALDHVIQAHRNDPENQHIYHNAVANQVSPEDSHAERVARESKDPEILKKLGVHQSKLRVADKTKKALMDNPRTPYDTKRELVTKPGLESRHYEHFANDEGETPFTRTKAMAHISNPEAIEKLHKKYDSSVEDDLKHAGSISKGVKHAIATNSHTPPHILHNMALKHMDSQYHWHHDLMHTILHHNNTPRETIKHVAENSKEDAIKSRAKYMVGKLSPKNESTEPKTLTQFLEAANPIRISKDDEVETEIRGGNQNERRDFVHQHLTSRGFSPHGSGIYRRGKETVSVDHFGNRSTITKG